MNYLDKQGGTTILGKNATCAKDLHTIWSIHFGDCEELFDKPNGQSERGKVGSDELVNAHQNFRFLKLSFI